MSGDAAGRLIVRGGLASAGGFAIRLGARLLFLFVAGRLFGASLFGAYAVALALVEIGVLAAGLGTRFTLFQWLDEGRRDRPAVHTVHDAALLVGGIGAGLAVVAMATVALLPNGLIAPATVTAILIMAATIPLQALIELTLAATRWTHAMRHEVIGKSIVQPYAGVAAAIAAYLAGLETTGLALSWLAGTLAAAVYAIYALHRSFGGLALATYRPDRAAIRERAGALSANGASDIAEAVFARVDIYAVAIFLGETPAGVYAMARQIAVVLRQVRQSVDSMLVPVVSRTLSVAGPAATGAAIASATRLVLLVQIPVLIAFVALGQPLLDWIGPGFAAGYVVLVLLSAAETVQGAFGIGDLLFVYRKPVAGLAITLATIVLAAVAAPLLIADFGLAGAGLAILGCYVVRAVLRRLVLARLLGVRTPLTGVAPVIAAAALGLWIATVPTLPPVADAVLGILAFALPVALWMRAAKLPFMPQGFEVSAKEP